MIRKKLKSFFWGKIAILAKKFYLKSYHNA